MSNIVERQDETNILNFMCNTYAYFKFARIYLQNVSRLGDGIKGIDNDKKKQVFLLLKNLIPFYDNGDTKKQRTEISE